MIGLVVVVLSLIAAPQFVLSATPLSFVKLHPDGLGLLAASDPNKVAAADLENLHDEEEEGEEEGGKDTRSSMFLSFSPLSGARLAWGICRRGAVGAEPIKSQAALYRLQCEGHQVSQPAGQAAERDGQMQELVRAQHRRGRRWLAGPNLFSPPARTTPKSKGLSCIAARCSATVRSAPTRPSARRPSSRGSSAKTEESRR